LVVDVDYRTKLTHAKYVNSSWISHSSWKDFFFGPKEGEPKRPELEEGERDEWEVFLEKFYQDNLQKLKC
jgi:hypothetical protein